MLTKETSVLFFVGALGTVVIRGGWRNWRGILLFCVALAIMAAPWYVYQWPHIKAEYTGIGQLYVSSVQSPPRFSLHSIDWYFWNLVNEQIGLPLTIAFVIGTGHRDRAERSQPLAHRELPARAARRRHRRLPRGHVPDP